MRTRLSLLSIFSVPFFFFSAIGAYAACGTSPEIGCKYYYCNPNTGQEEGARHTCYPMLGRTLCPAHPCDDCQGPNGDRCSGAPAPTSIPPSSVPPSQATSPTPLPAQITPSPTPVEVRFMGLKLGRLSAYQNFDIVEIFLNFFGSLFR